MGTLLRWFAADRHQASAAVCILANEPQEAKGAWSKLKQISTPHSKEFLATEQLRQLLEPCAWVQGKGSSPQKVLAKLSKNLATGRRVQLFIYAGPSDQAGNPLLNNQEALALDDLMDVYRSQRKPGQHLVVVLCCPGASAWVQQLNVLMQHDRFLRCAIQALDIKAVDSQPAVAPDVALSWLVAQHLGSLSAWHDPQACYSCSWGDKSLKDLGLNFSFLNSTGPESSSHHQVDSFTALNPRGARNHSVELGWMMRMVQQQQAKPGQDDPVVLSDLGRRASISTVIPAHLANNLLTHAPPAAKQEITPAPLDSGVQQKHQPRRGAMNGEEDNLRMLNTQLFEEESHTFISGLLPAPNSNLVASPPPIITTWMLSGSGRDARRTPDVMRAHSNANSRLMYMSAATDVHLESHLFDTNAHTKTISNCGVLTPAQARSSAATNDTMQLLSSQMLDPVARLGFLRAMHTSTGGSVVARASARLVHRVLTAELVSPLDSLRSTPVTNKAPQVFPGGRHLGRALDGEESNSIVFADDAVKWAYLKHLVEGNTELEDEINSLALPEQTAAANELLKKGNLDKVERSSCLLIMQATRSRTGQPVSEVATPQLLLQILASGWGDDVMRTTSVLESEHQPSTRRRQALQGDEKDSSLDIDDMTRWAYLHALVAGDPELEAELESMQPTVVPFSRDANDDNDLRFSIPAVQPQAHARPVPQMSDILTQQLAMQRQQAMAVANASADKGLLDTFWGYDSGAYGMADVSHSKKGEEEAMSPIATRLDLDTLALNMSGHGLSRATSKCL